MDENALAATARKMVAPGRGVLAADESTGTIKKRFDTIKVDCTEENRRAYRDLLFTTKGFEDYISGVILFEETLFQSSADGTGFAALLANKGAVPGIKVDKGAQPLAGAPGETVTEGLDGLRQRLEKFHEAGARFAKWRAVITIGDGLPSAYAIDVNAHALARYAALCQEAGIVPIVEPEVLMDGDNTIAICERVTTDVLQATFAALHKQRVLLEGMILKPNMVISGKQCAEQANVTEVATATMRTLRRCVPSAVPGVAFLSGGQSDALATQHLNAMNKMDIAPWSLTFSYGRALQAAALTAWSGKAENIAAAQKAFAHRAKLNGLAATGRYSEAMEAA